MPIVIMHMIIDLDIWLFYLFFNIIVLVHSGAHVAQRYRFGRC